MDQYPKDYNPPLRGLCEVCACETKGWTTHWLDRCPKHWQELVKR
jgi:hypothetical protein